MASNLSLFSLAALAAFTFVQPIAALALKQRAPGPYKILREYSGEDFFDGFAAFTGADPTNGHVKYTALEFAAEKEFLGIVHETTSNTTHAYIGVDSTNIAPNGRNSLRLESTNNIGINSLVVADIARMPTGCGLWPAFWLLGAGEWPYAGEIDILESVHDSDHNSVTLHTSTGCTVNSAPATLFQGKLSNPNCNANNAAEGCSVVAPSTIMASTGRTMFAERVATAGAAFNLQGGGVYAMHWTTDGIAVYLLPRDSQPADLVAGRPDPTTWIAAPIAKFTGHGCDFAARFKQMRIIINTDFCGDWAGQPAIWESSGCRAKTQTATCSDYVANHPEAFRQNSSWRFRSIKVYT